MWGQLDVRGGVVGDERDSRGGKRDEEKENREREGGRND